MAPRSGSIKSSIRWGKTILLLRFFRKREFAVIDVSHARVERLNLLRDARND
jgi:hypothetical protein